MSGMPAAPTIERPRKTFVVPAKCRVFAADPSKVTLVPITAREEMDGARAAIARGGGTDAALTHELCRRSVVAIDDKPINWGDAGTTTAPEWIDATSPQFRRLLASAFLDVNRPNAADEADFLASGTSYTG